MTSAEELDSLANFLSEEDLAILTLPPEENEDPSQKNRILAPRPPLARKRKRGRTPVKKAKLNHDGNDSGPLRQGEVAWILYLQSLTDEKLCKEVTDDDFERNEDSFREKDEYIYAALCVIKAPHVRES